jgi:hypothetical protein
MAASARGSNPTVRDNRLDSIGIWIYLHLIVECSHIASLFSLELAILPDRQSFENILAIYLLVFVLVKS